MGWPDSTLREQYDDSARTADGSTLGQQAATNEAEMRARQTRQRAVPGPVANDVSGRASVGEAEARNRIDKGHAQIAQDAGTLSKDYKGSVRAGKISPHHGGNRAVWDTVDANASQPNLGTPPKVEPIGEWHFGKDGVPLMGPPPPEPETTVKPSTAASDGRPRTDQGGKPGKR
jgi:hypothetical protein